MPRDRAGAAGRIDGSAGGVISIRRQSLWRIGVTATAKLFTHGRSQAVRLPKEFRFEGREVRVTKVGRRVILEPMEPDEPMPCTAIDQLGDSRFMPEGREQPEAPPDRAVFES